MALSLFSSLAAADAASPASLFASVSQRGEALRAHPLVRRSPYNHDIEASGMPWKNAVGFLAAIAFVLGVMIFLALVLQCANPPRMEARHFPVPQHAAPYAPTRARSQRRISQLPRPPSGRTQLGSSPSQVGLLDQVQPQPVTSRRARRDGRRSRQLPDPPQHLLASEPAAAAPYTEIAMPPAVRGQHAPQEYYEYTTPSAQPGSSRRSRNLPLPPPDLGAPLMDPVGAYSEYHEAPTYADASPFEAHDRALATRMPPRSARGYVPLPEPPMQTPYPYTDAAPVEPGYYDTPVYQQELSRYSEGNRSIHKQNSMRSRHSGLERTSSQLSRVDSIGAGDHRRHSRKLPQPPVPRMTTAERVKALRSVTQQDMYGDEAPVRPSRELPKPAPPVGLQDLYHPDALSYPVREEHRYGTGALRDEPRYGSSNYRTRKSSSDRPKHRYKPI